MFKVVVVVVDTVIDNIRLLKCDYCKHVILESCNISDVYWWN